MVKIIEQNKSNPEQKNIVPDFLLIKKLIFTILHCLLFCGAFPNVFSLQGFSFLGWICLIPLFYLLDLCHNRREKTIWALISGFAAYSGLIGWLYPVHWFGALIFVVLLALQVVVWSLLYSTFKLSNNILVCAALWVVSEFLRIQWLGGFEWTLAHSQTFNPWLIQIFDLTGPLGLSFIIVLVNGLSYKFLKHKYHWKYLVYAGMVMGLVAGYGAFKIRQMDGMAKTKSFQVCLVQPDTSSQDKKDPDLVAPLLERDLQLSRECFRDFHPDAVIWPETAIADDVRLRPDLLSRIGDSALFRRKEPAEKGRCPLFLTGSALWDGRRDQNGAVLLGPDATVWNVYVKQQLVPFLEFYPWGTFLRNNFYHQDFEFTSGRTAGVMDLGQGRAGIFICSEDGYARLFRKVAPQHPDFFILLLSDIWTRVPPALMMHLQNSIVRAVSFRTPLIRSANSGWSGAIDAAGRLARSSEQLNQAQVFKETIKLSKPGSTVYAKYGDFFAVICVLFVIMTLYKEVNVVKGVKEKTIDANVTKYTS
ncbi:MAG: apolipoprotein N-acyltransferase [Candidatus Omnitrophica bacterium]|nr:apolipoprotein N-acyltransferase [Candidatus Omnitrophota bacterium]